MGAESTPWGLYALMVFCVIVAISGFVWCVCCGTCVGRDTLRAAGLARFVPPPYMQPSFMNRGGYQRNRDSAGDEEEGLWEEEIDMDVLGDEQQDSSVEYDYELSDDDEPSDRENDTSMPYVLKQR